ncbi:MAG TPA: hypothetical protein VMB71_11580 [Acetobacteraceae bacterium]|nr:hypothetical protein [Acetobacteraceae bacterium]
MANGLLFASMDYTRAYEDEFHDWYDLEHVPERLRVPGFLNAERWLGEENPKISVATYDLTEPGVLGSAPYLAVGGANSSVWTRRVTGMCQRIMRYEGEQLAPGDAVAPQGAAALLVATMNIDPAAEAEFNEWYNAEHLPQLAAVPGVLCARRFRASDAASERRYLALYHLNGSGVSRSAAWTKAADTEWTRRIRPHFRDLLVLRCNRYQRGG